jgi:hypothetical protein
MKKKKSWHCQTSNTLKPNQNLYRILNLYGEKKMVADVNSFCFVLDVTCIKVKEDDRYFLFFPFWRRVRQKDPLSDFEQFGSESVNRAN